MSRRIPEEVFVLPATPWSGFIERVPAISKIQESDLRGVLACDDAVDLSRFEWLGQPRTGYRYGVDWEREPFDDKVKRVRQELGLIVCTCHGVQVDDDLRRIIYSPTCEVHGRHRRMGDRW